MTKDDIRTVYQDSFVNNYDKWHKVLKSFNSVTSKMYIKNWPNAILKEDIQFLPYDIDRTTYDDFCEMFLDTILEIENQEDTDEIFYAMVEKKLKIFYEKYTII